MSCGNCTACCKIMGVKVGPDDTRLVDEGDGSKPPGENCKHCVRGVGCGIYETRPENCKKFECMWLLSQDDDPGKPVWPETLRPDKCKVVFVGSPGMVALHVDPGYARQKPWTENKSVAALVERLARGGVPVFAVVGEERRALSPAAAELVLKACKDKADELKQLRDG